MKRGIAYFGTGAAPVISVPEPAEKRAPVGVPTI